MCVRAGHTPVLATGYELEALVFDRILVELMTHRRQVLLDATGDEARQWLQSPRGRGIGKRIAKVAKGDLYDLQSRAAHGDPRLLEPMLDAEVNMVPFGACEVGSYAIIACAPRLLSD